jgi:hypothetical protein
MLNVREQAAIVETIQQSLDEVLFELGQHGSGSSPDGAAQQSLGAYFLATS